MATEADDPLDYRTAQTQICRALVDRVQLALGERLPPVADLPSLRQLPSVGVMNRDLLLVQSEGVCYRFMDIVADPDDNDTTIQPLDLPSGPGRWVRMTDQSLYAPRGYDFAQPLCQIPSGYARMVQLYEGHLSGTSEDMLNRIFGRRPAILIRWTTARREQVSLGPSLYKATYEFKILGISYSPRSGPDAMFGSELPVEAAEDPGLDQILGDAADVVVGASDPATGYFHLVPGVDVCQALNDQIEVEELAERLFIGSTSFRVIAYLHRPDRDAHPFTTIGVQQQLVNERGQQGDIDLQNCIYAGYHVPWPQSSLVAQVQYGQAKVGGKLVASAPSPIAFPPSVDTYRDLHLDGSLTYQSVPNGAAPPAQQPKTLRIGLTSTDGTHVVFDRILVPTVLNQFLDEIP